MLQGAPFLSPTQGGWSGSRTCSWSLVACFNVLPVFSRHF